MEIISGKVAISYTPSPQPTQRCRCFRATRTCLAIWSVVLTVWAGCSGPDHAAHHQDPLIRSNGWIVTLAQFERAFEAARIAYGDDRSMEPELMHNARLRLLNQMVDELMAERRAEELGVTLNDNELESVIQTMTKDYPENEFEQLLLESAIPFSLWRERLRARLLMEKVIERELVQPLTITVQEIEAFYQANETSFTVGGERPTDLDLKRQIVELLRREKVEAAYPGWMADLRDRFGIEINWELWAQSQTPEIGPIDQDKDSLP